METLQPEASKLLGKEAGSPAALPNPRQGRGHCDANRVAGLPPAWGAEGLLPGDASPQRQVRTFGWGQAWLALQLAPGQVT